MRSHYNNKKSKKNIIYVFFSLFFCIILFTPFSRFVYDLLETPFRHLSVNSENFKNTSTHVLHTWYNKKKILEENQILKNKNNILHVDLLRTSFLEERLEDITETKLDFNTKPSFIIQKNNNGQITIQGGKNLKRNIDDYVFSYDGSLVGVISRVFDKSSYVSLFTKKDQESYGVLFPQDISITMQGNGNALVAEIARDIDVSVGDLVYSQMLPGHIMGQVSSIDFDPRDPSKKVFISRIYSLNSLQVVAVLEKKDTI